MNEPEAISLLALNKIIQSGLKSSLNPSYWVIAEISELQVNYNGHCYLELVEKPGDTDNIIARTRAIIWADKFRMIKAYFESTVKEQLQEGMKIMVRVMVEYHPLYSLSLNIKDIEPRFTMGDLASQKQAIINRLTDEGVLLMNKELTFPALPSRIAVISSANAAGYLDFVEQLKQYARYNINVTLFPAAMQGNDTEQSVIAALDTIYRHEEDFDIVAIIRGGGSQADLNAFNSYWLAYHIAQFPLPVITGIGHEKDDSISDMVAHTRLKTPTAVAEFIIECFQEQQALISELSRQLHHCINTQLDSRKQRLQQLAYNYQRTTHNYLQAHTIKLENYKQLTHIVTAYLLSKKNRLNNLCAHLHEAAKGNISQKQQHVTLTSNLLPKIVKQYRSDKQRAIEHFSVRNGYLNPVNMLKRGYSITTLNGKKVTSAAWAKKGDILETRLYTGKIISEVKHKL